MSACARRARQREPTGARGEEGGAEGHDATSGGQYTAACTGSICKWRCPARRGRATAQVARRHDCGGCGRPWAAGCKAPAPSSRQRVVCSVGGRAGQQQPARPAARRNRPAARHCSWAISSAIRTMHDCDRAGALGEGADNARNPGSPPPAQHARGAASPRPSPPQWPWGPVATGMHPWESTLLAPTRHRRGRGCVWRTPRRRPGTAPHLPPGAHTCEGNVCPTQQDREKRPLPRTSWMSSPGVRSPKHCRNCHSEVAGSAPAFAMVVCLPACLLPAWLGSSVHSVQSLSKVVSSEGRSPAPSPASGHAPGAALVEATGAKGGGRGPATCRPVPTGIANPLAGNCVWGSSLSCRARRRAALDAWERLLIYRRVGSAAAGAWCVARVPCRRDAPLEVCVLLLAAE